jgi:hypothetical protein
MYDKFQPFSIFPTASSIDFTQGACVVVSVAVSVVVSVEVSVVVSVGVSVVVSVDDPSLIVEDSVLPGDCVVIPISPLQDTGNVVGQFGSFGWKHASVCVELVQYNPKHTLLSSLQ